MIALAGSVLLASLLGSPHCAAMCGGFVCFYSGGRDRGSAWAHAAYNGGRLLSYVALGAIAGSLGAGLEHVGAMVGVGRAAAVVAGALMVAWGAHRVLEHLGVGVRVPRAGRLHAPIAAAMRAVSRRPPAVRALVLGASSTLLPCGWLYAFAATAAGTGSTAGGAAVMLMFWLGTVPVMVGLAVLAQRALGPLARRLPVVSAAVLIVLGVLTVAGKLTAASPATHQGCAVHGAR